MLHQTSMQQISKNPKNTESAVPFIPANLNYLPQQFKNQSALLNSITDDSEIGVNQIGSADVNLEDDLNDMSRNLPMENEHVKQATFGGKTFNLTPQNIPYKLVNETPHSDSLYQSTTQLEAPKMQHNQ